MTHQTSSFAAAMAQNILQGANRGASEQIRPMDECLMMFTQTFERMSQREGRETAHIITADGLKQSCHTVTCSIIKWPYANIIETARHNYTQDIKRTMNYNILVCRHQCYYH